MNDQGDSPNDPTPIIGAATDITRLGQDAPKPPHEMTADEERGAIDWDGIAATPQFRDLLRAKRRFIIPAVIVFVCYYFALPILVGYARPWMERQGWGRGHLGYR